MGTRVSRECAANAAQFRLVALRDSASKYWEGALRACDFGQRVRRRLELDLLVSTAERVVSFVFHLVTNSVLQLKV
jgi:hypothetical protein